MKHSWKSAPWVAGALLLLLSCSPPDPLPKLRRTLDVYPEYSVILQDMKRSGNFVKDYYHQYRVVYGERQEGSEELVYRDTLWDWMRVPRDLYERHRDHLGMTLIAKNADGEVEQAVYPPGYQYVGNPRYGRWNTDSSGRSFWVFYGQYALMRDLFGSFRQPFYRGDWDTFRDHRRGGRPYFGPDQRFGTRGTYTKTTNPNFFQRQKAREQASRQRFSDKVRNRSRSNMSSYRSRSGGRGK